MKFITSILAISFASVCVSACTHMPDVALSFLPEKASSQSTHIADYLKARFAARQQEFDMAAHAYSNVAQATPEDQAILRQALYYELAAGRVEKAVFYATQISQLDAVTTPAPSTPKARPTDSTRWLDRFLPYLVLAVEAAREGRYEEAKTLLETELGHSSYARSLMHLMVVWMNPHVDHLSKEGNLTDVMAQIATPAPGVFTGFIGLHQAFLLDLAGKTMTADTAYQSALHGFYAEVALFYRVAFLERLAVTDEKMFEFAVAELRGLVRQANPVRRAARLALLRLDRPLEGESRRSGRLVGKQTNRTVNSGRDGMAMVLYNFAHAALQQALSKREAIFRMQIGEARLLLEMPLALAQIAVYLKPDFHEARYLIGQIYTAHNLHGEALDHFAAIPFASPYYESAQLHIADALKARDETDRALKMLAKFYQRDSLAPEVAQAYAELLAEQQQYEEAIMVATQMIAAAHTLYASGNEAGSKKSVTPPTLLWRYYFARAAIYTQYGDWEAAEADLRDAMMLAPEQPALLNFLGYSWAERGENLHEAFTLIEKALRHYPYDAAIIDSLGWAHYQLGHFEEAVTHLERAIQLAPSDETITDHLGDAYWRIGRQIEARYQWRYALNLEPELALRQKIETKLLHGLEDVSSAQLEGAPPQKDL